MNVTQRAAGLLRKSVVAVAAALACAGAQAQTTTTYNFGVSLSGPASPSASFATLSATQSADGRNYSFGLSLASNFGSLFGNSNAFIRTVLFNTNATDPIPTSVGLVSGGWGVNAISYSSNAPQVGSVSFDFTETFGASAGNKNAGNRLTSGESVQWYTNFANPTSFVAPQFALHVQSIGSNGDSGWYIPTVTPIPEPETYALLLAGLGLLGLHARRRKQKEAAAA